MSDSSAGPERLVSPTAGRQAWTKQTYEVLVETAARYNAVITYADLAEEVQQRSGLRTTAGTGSWMPAVLSLVAHQCHRLTDPALTSLVIHKDGRVGSVYNEVLRIAGLSPIEDERERHAAAARLECYRRWGADVPPDATPSLPGPPTRTHRGSRDTERRATDTPPAAGTRASSTPRTSARSTARPRAGAGTEARRGAICPRCFMEMPLTGTCPNCS